MTLTRRTPLRRKPHRDPVTYQVRTEVIERDIRIAGGCVAPYLDQAAGDCRPTLRAYLAEVAS